VSLPDITNINRLTGIYVYGAGSTLTFPAVTNYAQPANTGVVWTVGDYGATEAGCTLDFPALKTITGSVETNSYSTGTIVTTAQAAGASIDFPALTSITEETGTTGYDSTDGVELVANYSGVIDVPVLVSFTDGASTPGSSLNSYNGGEVAIPELTTLAGVTFNLNIATTGAQVLKIAGSLVGAIAVDNGAQVSLPNITNVNRLTGISVYGAGSTLTFPAVTNYAQPANTEVAWAVGDYGATEAGCALNFPALKAITGSVETNSYTTGTIVVTVQAAEASINFSELTTITVPAGTLGGDSSDGVQLVANESGTLNAPVLTSFMDRSTPPESSLSAYNSGVLNMPDLLATGISGVTLNGFTAAP
jgi:hypothetical protein